MGLSPRTAEAKARLKAFCYPVKEHAVKNEATMEVETMTHRYVYEKIAVDSGFDLTGPFRAQCQLCKKVYDARQSQRITAHWLEHKHQQAMFLAITNAPATFRCSSCKRRMGEEEIGCRMPQPNGMICDGLSEPVTTEE